MLQNRYLVFVPVKNLRCLGVFLANDPDDVAEPARLGGDVTPDVPPAALGEMITQARIPGERNPQAMLVHHIGEPSIPGTTETPIPLVMPGDGRAHLAGKATQSQV